MTDTRAATDAPRYAPNCKHAYMNDGFDCPFCLRDRLATSETRVKELERESEWRGVLIAIVHHGCDLIQEDRDNWLLELSDGSDIMLGVDKDGLPAHPSDDVVAKIKEEVR